MLDKRLGNGPALARVRAGLRLSFGASNCSSVHHLLPFPDPRRDPGHQHPHGSGLTPADVATMRAQSTSPTSLADPD